MDSTPDIVQRQQTSTIRIIKKPSQRAGGYRIGSYNFIHIKKQVVIKIFIHVHFKREEKYYVAR